VATIAADGTVLDTWFPEPELSGDGSGGQERSDSGIDTAGTNRLSVAAVSLK